MKITYDTEKFEAEHGTPSGSATWTFDVLYHDGNGRYTTDVIVRTGTYAAAKKEAASWARTNKPSRSVEAIIEVTKKG